MSIHSGRMTVAATVLVLGVLAARPAAAQQPEDANKSMASRADLEALASRLDPNRDNATLARVRARLTEGDFRPGDRIAIFVQGDTALTDTFQVWPTRDLRLPSPTVGSLSLVGVLRSELEPKVSTFVARFVRNPVVRARPMMRVSVIGEVVHSGFHTLPPDAPLSDAFDVAGGTTPMAEFNKARIERNGRPFIQGNDLQRAMASGQTMDEAGIRDGDSFVVPRKSAGMAENLRLPAMLVSMGVGIYALTKAIH